MTDPFETVAFLANSENRVHLLAAVAEKPHTRADLQEETDIARATLGRILADLQDRGWVRQDGNHYEATPEGAYLVTEFESLVDTVAALDELGDLVQWFPIQNVSFDFGRLRHAKVTRPSKQDALKPITRSLELIGSARYVRLVAGQHAPPALKALRDAIVEEERLTLEFIVTEEIVETIFGASPDREFFRDLVASDRVELYRTSIPHEFNYVANDDTILFTLSDEHGAPQALVETDDPIIREWFESFFETTRQDATRLTLDDFPE